MPLPPSRGSMRTGGHARTDGQTFFPDYFPFHFLLVALSSALVVARSSTILLIIKFQNCCSEERKNQRTFNSQCNWNSCFFHQLKVAQFVQHFHVGLSAASSTSPPPPFGGRTVLLHDERRWHWQRNDQRTNRQWSDDEWHWQQFVRRSASRRRRRRPWWCRARGLHSTAGTAHSNAHIGAQVRSLTHFNVQLWCSNYLPLVPLFLHRLLLHDRPFMFMRMNCCVFKLKLFALSWWRHPSRPRRRRRSLLNS